MSHFLYGKSVHPDGSDDSGEPASKKAKATLTAELPPEEESTGLNDNDGNETVHSSASDPAAGPNSVSQPESYIFCRS